MARYTEIELTNMIMIENPVTQEILVENRQNPNWAGVTFPGGHIEVGETVTQSVYREAYEETGLTIVEPQLKGIKEWPLANEARYIVFLYKATSYTGEIHASREGDIFWTTREKLLHGQYHLPNTFAEMLPVFDDANINELALHTIVNGVEQHIAWQ
ncbi:NUDIX domain-containing protein [Weissella paramesenteroides]|nr:NUDIX domain-containing protein [Weissella paramesenteroides]KAA8438247.1 NUDIX domain-containing protein [Weissella paramesenteroides]